MPRKLLYSVEMPKSSAENVLRKVCELTDGATQIPVPTDENGNTLLAQRFTFMRHYRSYSGEVKEAPVEMVLTRVESEWPARARVDGARYYVDLFVGTCERSGEKFFASHGELQLRSVAIESV